MSEASNNHDLHTTEELFNFPCEFPIKVIGDNNPKLLSTVIEAINKHLPTPITEENTNSKLSKNKNYLSITATITAESKKQLDAIYLDLNASSLVKMTL
jgi:putative lipoic acid-binding regulatory protein